MTRVEVHYPELSEMQWDKVNDLLNHYQKSHSDVIIFIFEGADEFYTNNALALWDDRNTNITMDHYPGSDFANVLGIEYFNCGY